MKFVYTSLAIFIAGTFAFPTLNEEAIESTLEKRQFQVPATKTAARQLSRAQTNCGPLPCPVFDEEEQFVSVTGQYAYASPAKGQIRGLCPGLNAAANHGYLPRDGVATIPETITGLGQSYGMSPDLAGFLAAYAIALSGDIITQTWSIGGPQNALVVPPLLSPPQGISYSHNKYEGDTSIGRNDAYINNGDAQSLNVSRFAYAFKSGLGNDRYTLDKFRRVFAVNTRQSIRENPRYFAPLFSTTLVSPAAYNFVINFMSNHSAEEPSGYLNGAMFKQFFAVKGNYPNFRWLPGQERIPNNWYRRTSLNQYNAANVFQDLIVSFIAYPDTFRFGGNTNGRNSYQGVDIRKLTGGTFDIETLFQGNNFACLVFQTQQQAVPDQLKGLVSSVAPIMSLLSEFTSPIAGPLACPQLAKYDSSVFNKYPGRKYSPKAPGTNG